MPSPDLDVLLFGDPQPKNLTDVGYYERDIVEPLIGKTPARLGMSLGDIVNDDLSLYPALKAVDARLGLPWLHVPGNHDVDFDAARDEDSLQSFRQAFGPDTYAWEEAGANFIVLDDVIYQPGQKPAYIGGLREDQFEFLEAYLRLGQPATPAGGLGAHPVLRRRRGRGGNLPARRPRTPVRAVAALPARAAAQCALARAEDLPAHGRHRLARRATLARVQRRRGLRRLLVGRARCRRHSRLDHGRRHAERLRLVACRRRGLPTALVSGAWR